jgi:NTE family protein
MAVPVYGVFEGGGIAGIAHAGAIKAARSSPYDCKFFAVAGTSAGAVAAALVAAGFSDDELRAVFEDLTRRAANAESSTLTALLTGYDWETYRRQSSVITKRLDRLDRAYQATSLKRLRAWWAIASTLSAVLKIRKLIIHTWTHHGIFKVDGLVDWLDTQLRRKLPAVTGPIMFEHLQIPLKVVAARVDEPDIVIFSHEQTPDVPVATAVGASICIPIFFMPLAIQMHSAAVKRTIGCVDGGLVSSFPAWAFDEENDQAGLSIPTLGFRLITEASKNPTTFREHLAALIRLVIRGDQAVHLRTLKRPQIAVSDTSSIVPSLKFDLTPTEAQQLWEVGYSEMNKRLAAAFPTAEQKEYLRRDVCSLLATFCTEAHGALTKARGGADFPLEWLRANVFVITDVGKAGIASLCHNMEGHPDRDFEFPLFGGSTGTAFARHTQVITPLYLAPQDEYHDLADAYQAFVNLNIMNLPQEIAEKAWPRLKTILSTPIADPADSDRVIAVLNLDTCCTLGEIPLYEEQVLNCAAKFAAKLSTLLSGYRFSETRAGF